MRFASSRTVLHHNLPAPDPIIGSLLTVALLGIKMRSGSLSISILIYKPLHNRQKNNPKIKP